MNKFYRREKEIRDVYNLIEVLDLCCEAFPIIKYEDKKDMFVARCRYCPMEEQGYKTVDLMINWNKAVRKRKGVIK
jgi:hypothetical protein